MFINALILSKTKSWGDQIYLTHPNSGLSRANYERRTNSIESVCFWMNKIECD